MPPDRLGAFSHSVPGSFSKEDIAGLMKAAMIHRDSQRFEEARDLFSSVRALCPAEPGAEIGLGSTCFAEGRFDAAIGHYRQALRLSPCNAYAYALLGESQIFKGEYRAARVSLQRACELDPKGPYGRLAQQLLALSKLLLAHEFIRQDRQT